MKKKVLILLIIVLSGVLVNIYLKKDKVDNSIDIAINKWYEENNIDIKGGFYLSIDYLKELGIENISDEYKCAYVKKVDDSIEIEKYKNCINGDINDDGKIDSKDLDLLKTYLEENKILTDLELIFANVNNDEYINKEDYDLLLNYIGGKDEIKKETSMEEVSKILEYSVGSYELTNEELTTYDYNKDGKVNSQDSLILLQQLNGKITYNLGDLNKDGMINSIDSLIILQHVSAVKILKEDQLKLADVNEDGVVNKCDSELILKYSVKQITSFKGAICASSNTQEEQVQNPSVNEQPIKPDNADKCIYGDVNGDLKIDKEDSGLILSVATGQASLSLEQIKGADVNLDGLVNSNDALIILKYTSTNETNEIIGTTFECK